MPVSSTLPITQLFSCSVEFFLPSCLPHPVFLSFGVLSSLQQNAGTDLPPVRSSPPPKTACPLVSRSCQWVPMCWVTISMIFFIIFWPRHVARRILVPQLGIKLVFHAVETWSLNHWTAREVPRLCFLSRGRGGRVGLGHLLRAPFWMC